MLKSKRKKLCFLLLIVTGLVYTGCWNPLRKEPVAGTRRAESLTSGYSLLKHLAGQETRVGLITWVKDYNQDVESLLQEISKAAVELQQWLGQVETGLSANGVKMNAAGLPEVEVWARQWIEDQTKNAILGGEKQRSELVMVISQAKATEYIAALSAGIANIELNDERRNVLKVYSDRFAKLHEHAIGLLRVRTQEDKSVENLEVSPPSSGSSYDQKP